MNILDRIIARKVSEIASNKETVSYDVLEKRENFNRQTISISKALREPDCSGIIAEYKRQSPSRGVINGHSAVADVARAYEKAGVAAVSVLTDRDFFGGSDQDLITARGVLTKTPILRKDFVIDEYQILEAKALGADFILLIAAALTPQQNNQLAAFAKSLGLEVLMEVNSLNELQSHLNPYLDLVGVNNRNLKDFSQNIQLSFDLAPHIPHDFVKVAESSISGPEAVIELRKAGFQGFLIGETFMKTEEPGAACADFIDKLKVYKQ